MIVGLGGWAESGKDALADLMVEHDPRWTKTYMSYPLEQALLVVDPYVPVLDWHGAGQREEWERYSALHARVGYADSKKNPEARRLLKKLGTDVGREMFDENVWVNKTMAIADRFDFVIVTSIRYHNEMKAILDRGGATAWVSRPGIFPIDDHSSDNTLGPEDFRHTIENNGSLAALAKVAADFSDYLTTYKEPVCTQR